MNQQYRVAAAFLAAVTVVLTAQAAMAGTGGSAFDQVWMDMTDWTQGTLGRVIAGSMILVGSIMGVARQSIMSFAIGVGAGVGLNNSPKIIESIVTATLPVAHDVGAAMTGILPG